MKLEEGNGETAGLYDDLDPAPSTKREDSPWGSRSPTPVEISEKRRLKEEERDYRPTLIWDLREAAAEAMQTFIQLEECTYQNKQLGSSHQLEESMLCECHWDPNEPEEACGPECINRLTQVECVKGECRCGSHCLNQRFRRKQYAPLDIVLTEKKGYGVRATKDFEPDTFIYEYIGEVIPHNTFVKRIKDYADDGIEHFYFMMLQKDEYIDATKKGGIGRFLNHSCRPNCYVAKWVVGKKMRMGIFAKREIQAGEELTFNYNVDRYGHDAQECYCGESNCVGFIGGKTQTDIGAMDDLYLEALGIMDDVVAHGRKGSKKRKSQKLDEDYIPNLTPIPLEDAPKVASAIRQATSIKRILTKLLHRVQITTDAVVLRRLMQLHGISLMGGVLREHEDEVEIVAQVIEILLAWPLITRNKLQSSGIEPLIEKFTLSDHEGVAARAQELVKVWATLELGYRIPKAVQEAVDAADAGGTKRRNDELFETLAFKRQKVDHEPIIVVDDDEDDMPRFKAAAATIAEEPKRELPSGWQKLRSDAGVTYYKNDKTQQIIYGFPTPEIAAKLDEEWRAKERAKMEVFDVDDILVRARREAQQREELRAAEEAAQAAEKARRKAEAKEKAKRKEEARKKEKAKKLEKKQKKASSSTKKSIDPAVAKEKACMRAFGTVVVNTMSRYKASLDVEQFKRRAKEITQLLVDKEKKSSSYEKETYASLSKEKTAKIRKFVDEYVQKLISRKKSSSSKASPSKPADVSAVLEMPASPVKTAETAADEEAMVRELAGDDEPDEADVASEDEGSVRQSDGETPDRDQDDTPGSTPSSGAQAPHDKLKPAPAVPPAEPSVANGLSSGIADVQSL